MHGFQQKLFSAKCCLSLFQRKGPSQPLEVVFFFCSAGGGGVFNVNLPSCVLSYCMVFIYILLWRCFFFSWQEGEIEGSGRVMFGLELQTANGMSEVLVSIQLFPFVSCY
jgi:hypothetical protein